MLALFHILMRDVHDDSPEVSNMKRRIYGLSYMDNCAFTSNDLKEFQGAAEEVKDIFGAYKFDLQQYSCNVKSMQSKFDEESGEDFNPKSKLLGLEWDRVEDCLSVQKLSLDKEASTKRQILSTIAANFDLFGYMTPLLNRARLYMHRLQCDKSLSWDSKLSESLIREWKNISKQIENCPCIPVKRCVGFENGIATKLVAFTDSFEKTLRNGLVSVEYSDK